MLSSFAIQRPDGLALITLTGPVDDAEAQQVERAIVQARLEHGCSRMLCDMRNATLAMSICEVDGIPQKGIEMGIDGSYRIALLHSDDDRKFQHLENVANIHGLDYRDFTEEAKALAWLKRDS